MVPEGWYMRNAHAGRLSAASASQNAVKAAVSVVVVYDGNTRPRELCIIKDGDKKCGEVELYKTNCEDEPGGRAIHSCINFSEGTGLLSVESSDSAEIHEMLLYSRAISGTDRQKAETYLAIKHGVTLPEYVSEAGDTLWSRSTDGDYTHRVFGIAHDSVMGLYKTSGGAKHDDEEIIIEAADSLKAGEYLLCGEKGGAPDERTWRIVREGLEGGTVVVKTGRNGRWRDQEPVAVLTEEKDGLTTEKTFESVGRDKEHHCFAVRFGEGGKGRYKLHFTDKGTSESDLAEYAGDRKRENTKEKSRGIDFEVDNPGGEVRLYPNPSNDFVVIEGLEGEKKEVEITNTLGRICLKAYMLENENIIDINTLAAGSYIVVLRGKEEHRIKLIKTVR